MRVVEVEPAEWEERLRSCSLSSIYQDPRWLRLIASIYPRLPIARWACLDDSGELAWLLPLVSITPLFRARPMLISLPFGNYGGFALPRTRMQCPTAGELDALQRHFAASPAFALEIRELEARGPGLETDHQFERYEVEVPEDEDTLWNGVLSGNARTSVRKAEKLGVEVLFEQREGAAALQRVYEEQASDAGTPIHHRSWYPMLLDLFSEEQEVLLARCGGEFVGAALLLHFQGRAILHMALTSPRHRQTPVADKLYWSCLQSLVRTRRSRILDLGRTRRDAGQRFFKRKWGGVARPIAYSYLRKPGIRVPRLLPENPRLKWPIRVWRRLPMAAKRAIGPHLRVRIPT